MSNQIGMANVKSILALRQNGWSYRRIAQELGINRGTVERYVRQANQTDSKPAKAPPGFLSAEDSKCTTQAPPGKSLCEPFRKIIRAC